MHTIKITPNLLFGYQSTSGKFIRLPNRIEKIDSVANRIKSKLFFARIGMLYYAAVRRLSACVPKLSAGALRYGGYWVCWCGPGRHKISMDSGGVQHHSMAHCSRLCWSSGQEIPINYCTVGVQ